MNYVLKVIRGAQSTAQISPVPITLCAGILDRGAVDRALFYNVPNFMLIVREAIDKKLKSKQARWVDTKVWTPFANSTRVTVTTKLKGLGHAIHN